MSWETRQLSDNDYNDDGTIRTGMGTIKTQPSSKAYREGWDRIFGKKQKHTTKIKKLNVTVETSTCDHLYSRQMDQPYPRRCIKCNEVEPTRK